MVQLTKGIGSGSSIVSCAIVGVTAIVFNKDREILVVTEQTTPDWRKPVTGYVEDYETILEAARREVYEETKITADELGTIGFTESIRLPPFSTGEYACKMPGYNVIQVLVERGAYGKPASTAQPEPCRREVVAAEWMSLVDIQRQAGKTIGHHWATMITIADAFAARYWPFSSCNSSAAN